MARIVISDSSVLMDLAKTGLVEAALLLPFEFVIPDVMVAEELLDLGSYTADQLLALGFKEGALDGKGVTTAFAYTSEFRAELSRQDCFALTLAEVRQCILMTGDRRLRRVAESKSIEVHGLIWLIDLMIEHAVVSKEAMLAGLERLASDPKIRLPRKLLNERLQTLRG
ncbi:hypothetical protein [Magnetospirillum sp. 15-1]|uniref:hypothetical protein n=1 Tax=Magnetospirillum sp. 15-1 TaxID=1979370 RepID=UPI000BBBCD05|nr:hypothetical protein [Magnetospirillum sp. 15-1]